MAFATGCSEPEPEKKTVEEVKHEPPPPPPSTPPAELLAQHGIDDRVWLSETYLPAQDNERVSVASFFAAFVAGEADRLRPMLATIEQEELDVMVANGEFARLVDEIDGVEVLVGATPDGTVAVLGLFEFPDRIEGQMWEVDSGDLDEGFVLRAAPTPPGVHGLLGENPFDDWYAAVDAERALLAASDLGMEQNEGVASVGAPIDEGSGGGGKSPSGSGR